MNPVRPEPEAPWPGPYVELCGSPSPAGGPLVISCEHAGAGIPSPLRVDPSDQRWLSTHWALDIGAANVAAELACLSGSVGVLGRICRLVCDLNRRHDHPEWITSRIEEHELTFNRGIDCAERARRKAAYFDPYHRTIDQIIARRLGQGSPALLLAIHSFTPRLGDEVRAMEIGVLFDPPQEGRATRLARALQDAGFITAMNEPYSGHDGESIYSAWRHGRSWEMPYLEIELRQDLIATSQQARAAARRILAALAPLATG